MEFMMRMRSMWLVLVLGLMAGSAEATPFTFEFVLPPWTSLTSPALFDTNGVLSVTVDNGRADPFSEVYTFSQVTAITLSTTPGTFTDTWFQSDYIGFPGIAFFSTNASAVPLIDSALFSFTLNSVFTNPLGLDEILFAPLGFAIVVTPSDYALRGGSQTFTIAGRLVDGVAPVPEPATLTLVGLGSLGLGVYRRRRRRGEDHQRSVI